MKILLDEMYPGALADGLRAVGIQASTVSELKLAGSSDAEVFAAAVERGYAVLTEPLIAAIRAVSGERLDERIVYLDSVRPNSGLAIG